MKEQLRAFIESSLMLSNAGPLADDDQLLIDGIIDSLGVTRLIGFISRDLGIEVPARDATIDNFATLDVLTSYLEQRVAEVDV